MNEAQIPELTHDLCTPEELAWLKGMAEKNGYLAPTPMGNGRWCALYRLVFTCAIIQGSMFDDSGYEDRWCFDSVDKAVLGLVKWIAQDFEGEPQGWHRHPDSGRRRPEGDASKEHINP
jgi:hypothetical protein